MKRLSLNVVGNLVIVVVAISLILTGSAFAGDPLVLICHNGHSQYINESAVEAHLAHGDSLGECGTSDVDEVDEVDEPVDHGQAKRHHQRAAEQLINNAEDDGLMIEELGLQLVQPEEVFEDGKAKRSFIYEIDDGTIGMNLILWLDKEQVQDINGETGVYEVKFKVKTPSGKVVNVKGSYNFNINKSGGSYLWRYENQR